MAGLGNPQIEGRQYVLDTALSIWYTGHEGSRVMRAILYARTSGDDRGKGNLKTQIEKAQIYCQEKGYQIVAELAEDARGASGADPDLPQLNKALTMARAGEFDIFVTRELDRFARNLYKQYDKEQKFKKAGVGVEYWKYRFPDTPEGRAQKNMLASFAEYEREKIRERTMFKRREMVRGGNVVSHGQSPFGYEISQDNGKRTLTILEEEAEVVRKVFDLYTSESLSISETARRMKGTPSPADMRGTRDKRHKKRHTIVLPTGRKRNPQPVPVELLTSDTPQAPDNRVKV